MTPETSHYMAAADEALANARSIIAINIPRQAARLAYYAQFHSAQALIFERTAKISKTHKGVDKQFHKLVKADPALAGLAGQLSTAYYYKDVADYDTGTAPPITAAIATAAITTAEQFITAIRLALA